MIVRVDHIAFAVKNMDKAIALAEKYGGKHLFTSPVEKDGYEVAAVQLGECVLTFLQPVKEDSFVQQFIDRKGEGVHHIGVEAESLDRYIKELESEGIRLPQKELEGNGRREVLTNPKDSFGTVLQIIEWTGGANITPEERIERLTKYRT